MESTPTRPAGPIDWNIIVRQALILAIALIAFSALVYVLDFNTMSMSAGAINFLVSIAIGTGIALMTVRHQRSLDGGIISFGRAFTVGFAATAVGLFLSGFWNYILVNFIDPDYPTRMKEQFLETWGQSIPEDRMEEAVSGFDKMGSLSNVLISSFFAALLFGLICSLIAAAIGQKKHSSNGPISA